MPSPALRLVLVAVVGPFVGLAVGLQWPDNSHDQPTPVQQHQPTIAHGVPVSLTAQRLPFLAAIVYKGTGATDPLNGYHCAATFISNRWLLTAAHCVEAGTTSTPVTKDTFEVLSGTTELKPGLGTVHAISRIHLHPKYHSRTSYEHDIALVEIKTAATVSSASLADTADVTQWITSGRAATGAGWGITEKNSVHQTEFNVVDLEPVNQATCEAQFKKAAPRYAITGAMICAGKGGKGFCFGDSGGPLVIRNGGKSYIAGAASIVPGCGTNYSVYTSVPTSFKWINACKNSSGGTACRTVPPSP